MTNRIIHASVVNHFDSDSRKNIFDMGIIGTLPSILTITMTGIPSSSFESHVSFTIPAFPSASGSAHSYALNFLGIQISEITGFIVEVWRDTDPGKSTLYGTFPGNTARNLLGHLPAGLYHLDISGHLRSTADAGRYSVALQALPVPEPTTYALLLAGLGWARWVARRRKFA